MSSRLALEAELVVDRGDRVAGDETVGPADVAGLAEVERAEEAVGPGRELARLVAALDGAVEVHAVVEGVGERHLAAGLGPVVLGAGVDQAVVDVDRGVLVVLGEAQAAGDPHALVETVAEVGEDRLALDLLAEVEGAQAAEEHRRPLVVLAVLVEVVEAGDEVEVAVLAVELQLGRGLIGEAGLGEGEEVVEESVVVETALVLGVAVAHQELAPRGGRRPSSRR